MKALLKYAIIIILILSSLLTGILWGRKMEIFKTHETENSQVMMKKISKVFKLVAVEAQVSEIYNYKQYRYWDINLLRKQALVRVKANVSIGYDFEEVEFLVDEKERIVTLVWFPDPKILSIDHELDYYDMEEGLFNSFDGEELTEISKKAKEYAASMIDKTELFDQAEEQKAEIMSMLDSILKSSGWNLYIEDERDVMKN